MCLSLTNFRGVDSLLRFIVEWTMSHHFLVNKGFSTPHKSHSLRTWCLLVYFDVLHVLLRKLLSLSRDSFRDDFTPPKRFRCSLDHVLHLARDSDNIRVEFFFCLWFAVDCRLHLFNLSLNYDKFVIKNKLCCFNTWESAEYTFCVLVAIHLTIISIDWFLGYWTIHTGFVDFSESVNLEK